MASKLAEFADTHRDSTKTLQRFNRLVNDVCNIADEQLDVGNRIRDATGLYQQGRWIPLSQTSSPSQTSTNPRRKRRRNTHPRQQHPDTLTTPDQGTIINSVIAEEVLLPRTSEPESPPVSITGARSTRSRNMRESALSSKPHSQDNSGTSYHEQRRSRRRLNTHLCQGSPTALYELPLALDEYETIPVRIWQTNSEAPNEPFPRIIQARLYPNFNVNVISQDLATKSRMKTIVSADNNCRHGISSATSGNLQVVHSVADYSLLWRSEVHSLTLTFSVVEKDILPGVPLLLGQPYRQQLEAARRWQGRNFSS